MMNSKIRCEVVIEFEYDLTKKNLDEIERIFEHVIDSTGFSCDGNWTTSYETNVEII